MILCMIEVRYRPDWSLLLDLRSMRRVWASLKCCWRMKDRIIERIIFSEDSQWEPQEVEPSGKREKLDLVMSLEPLGQATPESSLGFVQLDLQ